MVEAVVEYSYDAEQPDELSIKPGDLIKNVIMVEGGWWEGELNGKKGMFPDNFVKVVKNSAEVEKRDDTKKKQVQASKRQSVKDLANKLKDSVHEGPPPMRRKDSGGLKKKRAKVVFSYEPENDDELKLAVGETIDILKQEEEGWWEGVLNGKQGMFPSNFVEIMDEAETVEPEKTEPAADEDNLIKGKKVHGIGLGNIFGDGPIKLRSTTGKKPGDKPQEPPKTEKRTEASVRKVKDTSTHPTNPARANLDLVVEASSQYQVVRYDEVCEVVQREDRHNLNNSSELVDTNTHKICYMDSDCQQRGNDSLAAEEIFEDYNDTDLSVTDFANLEESTEYTVNTSNVSQDYENDKQVLGQSKIDVGNCSSYSVGNSVHVESDQVKDSAEYSENLKTILDDLDSCLDQSFIDDDNAHNSSNVSEGSVGENVESVQCYFTERVSSEGESMGQHKSVCRGSKTESTPINSPNISHAVDSVVVTKKRFVSTSQLSSDQTQAKHVREGGGALFGEEIPVTSDPVQAPLYLPGITKHPQVTYLSCLNSAGNLSPFMRSIANKYRLFEPDKSRFKEIDAGALSDETDEEAYSTFMMSHTLDAHLAPEQNESGSEDKQAQVNDMVMNYVYDVLADSGKEPKRMEATVEGLGESDIDLARKEFKPEDDESMMVCVDEYSTRFMDVSSKENLSMDQDYRTDDDEDSVSSDGAVLLTMTEGNDSSPPLSCCSGSLYPCLEMSTTDKLAEEASDSYPDENISHPAFAKSLSSSRSVEECSSVRYDQERYQNIPKYKTCSALSCSQQQKYRPIRTTSSFCRIPFKDDVPTFWFKKDFEESPQHRQRIRPIEKGRSPKRSLSQISDTFPTLLSLAEKIYWDEFKLKIEAFKNENQAFLVEKKAVCFLNDRSPARKKRRKVSASIPCQRLSPILAEPCERLSPRLTTPFERLSSRLALNFNSNALVNPDELCTDSMQVGPDLNGSVDTYFAEKIETPVTVLKNDLPSLSEVGVKSVSCSILPDSTKVDWSKVLFDKRTVRSQSLHRRKVKDVPVKEASFTIQTSSSGTSQGSRDYLIDLMNECSEKRRKRRFTPRSKSDLCDNSVQLLAYHKLDEKNISHKAQMCPSKSLKESSKKEVSADRNINIVDLILQQEPGAFVPLGNERHETEILPKHKVQELMQQIVDEGTNDVLSYFDHGDEPDSNHPYHQRKFQSTMEETDGLDKSVISLQEAVEEHVVSTSQKNHGLSQVIKLLDTRQKMYEAISEAVTFCAEEIGKEVDTVDSDEQDGSEINDTLESASKLDDFTPDPEALAREINNIDLSGTPVYATSQGADNEMKAFLNDALEPFDNILIESFASSTDSLVEEFQCNDASLEKILDDDESFARQEKEGDEKTIEIENDSVLAIVGQQCILHEETNEQSDESKVICKEPFDTTVEVLDDSILKVIGRQCEIHIQDGSPETGGIPKLKKLCCKAMKRKRREAKTTLRFRDNVYNSDYDEVFELEGDDIVQVSPTGQSMYQNKPSCELPYVRTIILSDGTMKAVILPETPIPAYIPTYSYLEQGIEIGMPDFESSPLLRMHSEDGSVGYYKTEDSFIEEDELILPDNSTDTQSFIRIHNNSPVNPDESWGENSKNYLEELSYDSFKDVPDIDERLVTGKHVSVDDVLVDVSDDSSWMEELMRTSSACPPGNESIEKDTQGLVMSDCPPVFDKKISSYPSPKN